VTVFRSHGFTKWTEETDAYGTLRSPGSKQADVDLVMPKVYSVREDAIANNFSATETEISLTLQSHQPSPQSHHAQLFIAEQSHVRRLMPIECERLQGFPDNWTAGQADTPRYKQMGNAVAVPVVEWILRRITDIETTHNDA